MPAYFVRRLVEGAASLLIASLLLYTLTVYMPGGVWSLLHRAQCDTFDCNPGLISSKQAVLQLENAFQLQAPWPTNYSEWLFAPSTDSGVLTGDLGPSLVISPGTPVKKLVGPGIPEMFTALLALIANLMLVVVVKRRGRPSAYMPHANRALRPTEANFTTSGYLRV